MAKLTRGFAWSYSLLQGPQTLRDFGEVGIVCCEEQFGTWTCLQCAIARCYPSLCERDVSPRCPLPGRVRHRWERRWGSIDDKDCSRSSCFLVQLRQGASESKRFIHSSDSLWGNRESNQSLLLSTSLLISKSRLYSSALSLIYVFSKCQYLNLDNFDIIINGLYNPGTKRKKCVFDSWGTKYLIRQNYYSRDQRP